MSKSGEDDGPKAIERAMEAFLRHASAFDVRPGPDQIAQIRTFVVELLRWNEKINLTAAKGPGEVLLRHVLDSLVPLRHLADASRLLDVGPGGGFPGIPIKILRPDLFIVLVEARRKKASFNQHIIDRLGLERTRVIWARLADRELDESVADRPFDAIITRAALASPQILEQGIRVLGPGGSILLMKGRLEDAELERLRQEASKHGRSVVRVHPYRLPGLDRSRHLVVIR